MANILIADDEKEIVKLLKIYIEANGNTVFEANDGGTALMILKENRIDLAIIDIMMPIVNGYEVIKQIRNSRYIPILVISAKTELSDRVFGIDLGADDYITKPFEPLEVAAKVRAHLRRAGAGPEQGDKKDILRVGNISLNLDECKVVLDDKETIDLTKAEFRILELFMRNPGKVLTKDQIYEYGWNNEYAVDDNTIRVIISRLRDKIGNDAIKTIRGLGYRLELK